MSASQTWTLDAPCEEGANAFLAYSASPQTLIMAQLDGNRNIVIVPSGDQVQDDGSFELFGHWVQQPGTRWALKCPPLPADADGSDDCKCSITVDGVDDSWL